MISPHTLPLALKLEERCGKGNVVYCYHQKVEDMLRTSKALNDVADIGRDVSCDGNALESLISNCDVLVENRRDFAQMERALQSGKIVIYVSERWFKPIDLFHLRDAEHGGSCGLWISGFLRMLMPFGFIRARKIVRLFKKYQNFRYLPVGVHAAGDMTRLCGLMNGDLQCLFKAPTLDIDRKPCGVISCSGDQNMGHYCLDKMRLWGYFVESFKREPAVQDCMIHNPLRVLWVGRMLGWKRVDTLIKAISGMKDIALSLYGGGPEEIKLKRIASAYDNITVGGMVAISKVREIMRNHDVYVLTSNEFEGWGAVVNEALEEGMCVLGTYEAGASATILPERFLFHSGDWRRLRELLRDSAELAKGMGGIGVWSVNEAARAIANVVAEAQE